MIRTVLFLFFVFGFSICANAQQPFTLVSSEKKTIKEADLATLEKAQTMGKTNKAALTFTENEIRLVVTTGPEDDMLSYRIQGMRNPTLVVPSGATLRVLFVNGDDDMKHDLRFGQAAGDFLTTPDINETVGTEKLASKSEDETMQAEEVVLKANVHGAYKYFCSVGGHAKGGMWGNIAVGVKPDQNMKMPKPPEGGTQNDMTDMPGMRGDDTPTLSPRVTPDLISKMPIMKMSSVTNIGDPMSRESSGTAWAPDSSPMYAYMKMRDNGGMLMLMGNMFVRYTSIGSTRDASVAGKGSRSRFDAPSVFMLMESVALGDRAQLGIHVMLSLDPLIERGYGYPLLYQTGEQFAGQPIHDRQHPHDLFSELAVTYSYKFNDKRSFYLYAGYPGEPALGPPTYMHRLSAANIPDAPIGHHWQDATHVTFGVVTAGFSFGRVKIEASAFNGREPDSNRWNFDKPRLDSFSGRLSFNPTKNLAFQISHGYIKSPERSEPLLKILRRTTASAIYNKKFNDERNWASTIVWGQNYGSGQRSNSFLFESNYDFYKNAVFGRIESVQKSGQELVLNPADLQRIFLVSAFSIGYVRDIVQGKGLDAGIGAMATLDTNPSTLNSYYGGTTHGGWQLFMRFRASKAGH